MNIFRQLHTATHDSHTIMRSFRAPQEAYEHVKEIFPEHGFITAFCGSCIQELSDALRKQDINFDNRFTKLKNKDGIYGQLIPQFKLSTTNADLASPAKSTECSECSECSEGTGPDSLPSGESVKSNDRPATRGVHKVNPPACGKPSNSSKCSKRGEGKSK